MENRIFGNIVVCISILFIVSRRDKEEKDFMGRAKVSSFILVLVIVFEVMFNGYLITFRLAVLYDCIRNVLDVLISVLNTPEN